ncbi:hypothetical protein BH20ACI2_BH20ACI2_26360 [soil metagenome]
MGKFYQLIGESMNRILFLSLLLLVASLSLFGQPRPAEKTADPNAPVSYEAKYEGGIFGASGREKGTLKIDDAASRVTFYRKDGREMFSIPYEALVVVYPNSKVAMSQTGNVASRIPIPGAALFGLMSTSSKFLILNFDDPDINAQGVANFKFDDKKLLLAFIHSLGTRARMTQRGDAYYRSKKATF